MIVERVNSGLARVKAKALRYEPPRTTAVVTTHPNRRSRTCQRWVTSERGRSCRWEIISRAAAASRGHFERVEALVRVLNYSPVDPLLSS